MKLTKLSYKTKGWELLDLELDQVNLIVAKNGTGKSKTLGTLQSLVKIFTQKSNGFENALWELTFVNSTNHTYIYKFETSVNSNKEDVVNFESLFVNNVELINRLDNGVATVFNAVQVKSEELNPPPNKLVIQSNRDVKKYPFIEELCIWAEESYGCQFANIRSFSRTSEKEYFQSDIGDLSIPALYELLNENSRTRILDEFNSIGYNLNSIKPRNFEKSVYLLINEEGIESSIFDFQLAQGMFRALFILIYIEYIFNQKKPTMIAIDDLCEGLDYERATKLGRLIFDKCLNSNIQLVATSNDSFLMDIVDIKYWNVLRRTGKVVTAINIKNHPKTFEDFRFTGLSNFDFFASDFLNQKLAS